jgi:hypothetical protein
MANAVTATRRFRRSRVRPAPSQPDFADFGTAFGLELSLQPAPDDVPSAPQTRVRGAGWWRTLAARRSAAR